MFGKSTQLKGVSKVCFRKARRTASGTKLLLCAVCVASKLSAHQTEHLVLWGAARRSAYFNLCGTSHPRWMTPQEWGDLCG